MNGKKAKYLRKLAGFVPSAAREYNERTVKTVMVDTGKVGADGTPVLAPQLCVTRSLVKGERTHYRVLKKAYKEGEVLV